MITRLSCLVVLVGMFLQPSRAFLYSLGYNPVHASTNGSCRSSEFNCPEEGKCIPGKWICDGDPDCSKGEDEAATVCTRRTCDSEEWRCEAGNQCLPVAWVCDGTADCMDGSDEKVCTKTCSDQEYKCDNGMCINPVWMCDDEDDCGDNSDEKDCNSTVTCDLNDFVCRNGACLKTVYVCDGDADCVEGEDEVNCVDPTSGDQMAALISDVCQDNEFRCRDQHYCIQSGWVCDGDNDCPDGSDEAVEQCGARRQCDNHEFQCQNGECIPGHLQCSGISDCRDGSDELHCGNKVETCDKTKEFNCGGSKMCIPVEKACDGNNDCGDWEDEPDTCNKNECEADNGGCQQICVDSATSYHCTCEAGYKLVNSTHCEDINECEIPGACSQVCINLPGSFKCDCMEGYRKESHDHTKCKAAEGHLSLLFTHKTDIRKLSLERNAMTSIVNQTRSSCALDYVFRTGMIYWTDVMEETMYTAPIDEGWRRETVIKNSVITADGLAVDWVYSHIYWTDSRTNTISMSDYQGKLVSTLLQDDLEEPRSIAVHPRLGWMFWSDWGKVPRIERAGMDGSHRQVIREKSLHWPNGITLDLVMDRIYWIDAKLHMIGSANLDGTGSRLVLFSPTVLRHPFSITVFEDKVYWSDWNTKAIYEANKFDGSNVTALTSSNVDKIPMTVHMYHPLRQPELPNYCLPYNGDCSHMCVPAPRLTENSARTSCVCPSGLILEESGRNCISDPTYRVEPIEDLEDEDDEEEEDDLSSLVVPENSLGHVSGMVIGTAAALTVLTAIVLVYMYRRRHLKRINAINFDNPVYRRDANKTESQDRNCSIIRENDYIDIAISETELNYPSSSEAS